MKINPEFGPQGAAEERAYAVEEFRVRIQAGLHALMQGRGLTQEVLAKRMEVSSARVSQIFSSRGNVTLRTMAEMLHAMEVKSNVECDGARLVISAYPRLAADEIAHAIMEPTAANHWDVRSLRTPTFTPPADKRAAEALIGIHTSPSDGWKAA